MLIKSVPTWLNTCTCTKESNIVDLSMREIEPPFEIVYKGKNVKISEHSIDDKRVFRVYLDNPLSITIGETRSEQKFWTSIPQGRQQEAEETGKLIAAYIRGKRK